MYYTYNSATVAAAPLVSVAMQQQSYPQQSYAQQTYAEQPYVQQPYPQQPYPQQPHEQQPNEEQSFTRLLFEQQANEEQLNEQQPHRNYRNGYQGHYQNAPDVQQNFTRQEPDRETAVMSSAQEANIYSHTPNNLHQEQRPLPRELPPPPAYNSYPNSYSNVAPDSNNYGGQPIQPAESPQTAAVPINNSVRPKPKASRLPKACNSCSKRKVKCDNTGPPCRPCAGLNIPCDFSRPTKRRGPPNKHAEEVRRNEAAKEAEAQAQSLLQDSTGQTSGGVGAGIPSGLGAPSANWQRGSDIDALSIATTGTPISDLTESNIPAEALASLSSHVVLGAELICPLVVLNHLIDDFFTYIHPLMPFPHEPSFRSAFAAREDLRNPYFLALLASMIGVLTASFPRKPRLHLMAYNHDKLYPSSVSLVNRCHTIATEARGSGYLSKEFTVYDAATSYFLGLAKAYTYDWKSCRVYFSETMSISSVVGAHKELVDGRGSIDEQAIEFGGDSTRKRVEPVDHIKQEIGRRVFWVMVVGIGSLLQLGVSFGELRFPLPTATDPYPPLPAEIDDEFIFHDHIGVQPSGMLSKLVAFNANVRIYTALTPLITLEMCNYIDGMFDWSRQKRVLEAALRNVKGVIATLPKDLELKPDSRPGEFESVERPLYTPMADYPGDRLNQNVGAWSDREQRKRLQFEIQKANVYISQLGTRSYFVEKYSTLQKALERNRTNTEGDSEMEDVDTSSGSGQLLAGSAPLSSIRDIEASVTREREDIVQDLLRVLNSISQENMEPNGGSLLNKIRQVASTLIEQSSDGKGPLASKTKEYLSTFIKVIMRFEGVSPQNLEIAGNSMVDEEQELRSWADLREHQMKFLQSGGFSNSA